MNLKALLINSDRNQIHLNMAVKIHDKQHPRKRNSRSRTDLNWQAIDDSSDLDSIPKLKLKLKNGKALSLKSF